MEIYITSSNGKSAVTVKSYETYESFIKQIISAFKLDARMILSVYKDGNLLNSTDDIHALENNDVVMVNFKYLRILEYLGENHVDFTLDALKTTDFDILSALLEVGCDHNLKIYSTRRYMRFIMEHSHGHVPDCGTSMTPKEVDSAFIIKYLTWTSEITREFVKSKWFNMSMFRGILSRIQEVDAKWFFEHLQYKIGNANVFHIISEYPQYISIFLGKLSCIEVGEYLSHCKTDEAMYTVLNCPGVAKLFDLKTVIELPGSYIKYIFQNNYISDVESFACALFSRAISDNCRNLWELTRCIPEFMNSEHYILAMKDWETFDTTCHIKPPTQTQAEHLKKIASDMNDFYPTYDYSRIIERINKMR